MSLDMTANHLLAGISSSSGMPSNLNMSAFWLAAGALLCLVEVFVPTAFTMFVMGVSAFVVAGVAMLLPSQVSLQVALWMVLCAIFVFLSHRWMPKQKASGIQDATEAETLTEILPHQSGRVLYEGSSWRARCGDETKAIAPKQKVYVVGRQGTTLVVMPENMSES